MAAPPKSQSLFVRHHGYTHVDTVRMRTCEKIPRTTAAQESGGASREAPGNPSSPTSSNKAGNSLSEPHEPGVRTADRKELHCEYIQQQRDPRRSGARRVHLRPRRSTGLPVKGQQHLSALR